jgi:hypothetical protein
MKAGQMKNSIEFNLKPVGTEIAKAGEKGESFLKSHGLSDDRVQTQIMVIRELIKSGKVFDDHQSAGNEMSINICVEEKTVTIEVRQPVSEFARDHQLQALDKTIQWIRGYQDPFTPFMILAGHAGTSCRDGDANSFGLARIAYEAGGSIDFYVSEDNILNLSAVIHLN